MNAPIPAAPLEVLRVLRANGHEALLVGGCVRDLLLGRAPKDWDVATDALPDRIEALFPKTVAVGKAFGIIAVVCADDSMVEVATYRADVSGDAVDNAFGIWKGRDDIGDGLKYQRRLRGKRE